MITATLTRMGRPPRDDKTTPVRIPITILKRIRVIASHLGMEPGDYIAEKMLPHIRKDEAAMANEIRNRLESDDD